MEAVLNQPESLKLTIINRSFWPNYPVIGEALLRFAEDAAEHGHRVSVIFCGTTEVVENLEQIDRGQGVSFYPMKERTSSSSALIVRMLSSILFAFWVLIKLLAIRPDKIYVSTDPPIVVPFITMLYCKYSGASFVYHLQDIHPEAANVVMPIHRWLYGTLVRVDSLTMCRAESLITITKQMADEICFRSRTAAPTHILNNPAISFDNIDLGKLKEVGFSFCGNVGRMQRIPLILGAIEAYLIQGGKLKFTFAGGGIYADQLNSFAEKFELFEYRGRVDPIEAAQISANFAWALLPIEDEVTRYAFPSKSSSYILSGAKILAVCDPQTSVAKWVCENTVGVVVVPEIDALVSTFFEIEQGTLDITSNIQLRNALTHKLGFDQFVDALHRIVLQ